MRVLRLKVLRSNEIKVIIVKQINVCLLPRTYFDDYISDIFYLNISFISSLLFHLPAIRVITLLACSPLFICLKQTQSKVFSDVDAVRASRRPHPNDVECRRSDYSELS